MNNTVQIGGKKHKALLKLKLTKKQFKDEYSFRARLGINIGRLLQLVLIEWEK